jgi:tetratricopeptide (TPR) repeat protein
MMRPYQPIASARLLHLQGRWEAARPLYAAALGPNQPPETRELAAMFHAECLYELGRFTDCRRELSAFLESYPESVWTDQIHYYLGLLGQSPHSAAEDPPSPSERQSP